MIGDLKLSVEIEGNAEHIIRALKNHPCLRKAVLTVAVPDGRPPRLVWYTLPEITPESVVEVQDQIGYVSRRLGGENVQSVQQRVIDVAALVDASRRKRQLDLLSLANRKLGPSAEAWLASKHRWSDLSRREAAKDCEAFEDLVLELEQA